MVEQTPLSLVSALDGVMSAGLLPAAYGVVVLALVGGVSASIRHAGSAWRAPVRQTAAWAGWSALSVAGVGASLLLLLAAAAVAWGGLTA